MCELPLMWAGTRFIRPSQCWSHRLYKACLGSEQWALLVCFNHKEARTEVLLEQLRLSLSHRVNSKWVQIRTIRRKRGLRPSYFQIALVQQPTKTKHVVAFALNPSLFKSILRCSATSYFFRKTKWMIGVMPMWRMPIVITARISIQAALYASAQSPSLTQCMNIKRSNSFLRTVHSSRKIWTME